MEIIDIGGFVRRHSSRQSGTSSFRHTIDQKGREGQWERDAKREREKLSIVFIRHCIFVKFSHGDQDTLQLIDSLNYLKVETHMSLLGHCVSD